MFLGGNGELLGTKDRQSRKLAYVKRGGREEREEHSSIRARFGSHFVSDLWVPIPRS